MRASQPAHRREHTALMIMEACSSRTVEQQDTKLGGEDSTTAMLTNTGDADEGYETAGKKDLLPTSKGLAKEQRKVT